jgi:hypothetical protein
VVLLCAVLNVLVLSGFLIRVLLILVLAVRWAQSWALMHQAHLVLNVDRVHGGSHRTVVQGVATSHVVSLTRSACIGPYFSSSKSVQYYSSYFLRSAY